MIPVVSVMLAVGAAQAHDDAVSLASLVEAHESSLGLVHEIEMTLNLTVERFKPGHVGPLQLATWQWAWKGNRERIRYVDHAVKPRDDGLPANRGDVFHDGDATMQLLNWDPENPQNIAPRRQGTVHAKILPRSRVIIGRDAKVALLWAFSGLIGEPVRYSLAELVAESIPPADIVGISDINGHACFQVHASIPAPQGESFGSTSFDVFLDPATGFLARRVDVEERLVDEEEKDVEKRTTLYAHLVRDVLEFKSCDGGVFVPVKMELRNYDEGEKVNPFSRVSFVVQDLVVNEPISSDAFDFRFPENSLVVHLPATEGRRKVELWGPDNKPIKEIRSPADLPPDVVPFSQLRAEKGGNRALWAGVGVVLVVLAIVALWLRRRS